MCGPHYKLKDEEKTPAKGKTPKKRGRPSKYSEEIADRICEEMINGRDLLAICSDEEFPNRVTVYRWMDAKPDFATRIARAREALGDHAAYLVQDVADKCSPETANADRVKLMAYQWRAARFAPRRYSERKVNELVGEGGGPIKTEATVLDASKLDPEARATLREALKAAKG